MFLFINSIFFLFIFFFFPLLIYCIHVFFFLLYNHTNLKIKSFVNDQHHIDFPLNLCRHFSKNSPIDIPGCCLVGRTRGRPASTGVGSRAVCVVW